MNKLESKFGMMLRHWVKFNHKKLNTCGFENKDSRGKDYISYSEIKDDQLDYGMAIKTSEKGVLIRTQSGNGEPDYIYMKLEPSYVICKFPDQFSMIDVETLQMEKKRSKRKSLTSKRASELSIFTVKTKQ